MMIIYAPLQDSMDTDLILETGQDSGKWMPKSIRNAIYVKNGYIHLFSSILKDCYISKKKLNHITIAIWLISIKEKKWLKRISFKNKYRIILASSYLKMMFQILINLRQILNRENININMI